MKDTFSFVKSNMKLALFMIKSSLSVLLPFEILYRLIAVWGIAPLGSIIVSGALRISGIAFITEENLAVAFTHPVVILSFILVIMIIGVYTILEISFLTSTYNQCCQGMPLGFFRMLAISASDAIRVLKPKNFSLLILMVFVIPISSSFLLSSLFNEIAIPGFIIEVIMQKPLYTWGLICLLIISVITVLRYIFVLHEYTLEDKKIIDSAKTAVSLAKGKRIKILCTLIIWQGITWCVSALISTIIKTGVSGIAAAFSQNQRVYSSILTLNIILGQILKFVVPSLLVFGSYAIISAMYFKIREEKNGTLPGVILPVDAMRGKNNLKLCLLTIFFTVAILAGFSYKNANAELTTEKNQVQIVAHRGYYGPENTLPAFQMAIDIGADYIELDVQETRDGEVVVVHDANMNRLTGVNANVWELTLEELKKLDFGKKTKDFKGTKIPTLREVINLCRGKIRLNIELKINGHQKKLEESVAKILEEEDFENQIVISSLNKESLKRFKAIKPDIPCGYIVSVAIGSYINEPWSNFFSVEETLVNEKLVKDAHKQGKAISVWTVNKKASSDYLVELGVDSIITNNPVMIKESILARDNPLTRLINPIG